MNNLQKKFTYSQIVVTLVLIALMGTWMTSLMMYNAPTYVVYVLPLVALGIAGVWIMGTLNPVGRAINDAGAYSEVLAKMLKTLTESPGESREFEGFVFAHLVPFMRKHPDDLGSLFAGVPYHVTYRLIDYVGMLTKTEDQAFRTQPEPQSARTYKMILADIEELEQLSSALKRIAGDDLRSEEDKNIGFAPVMN